MPAIQPGRVVMTFSVLAAALSLSSTAGSAAGKDDQPAVGVKKCSCLYPAWMTERAQANAAKYPWAAAIRDQILRAAEPWLGLADDRLWDLMFGPAITRSWMVWSDGHCPACGESVPMYNWQIDALKRPWKVRCPHCQELFPKNDFHAFYRSGQDARGLFDPKRADRSLLFNADHPDADDPLRTFGVDDGEGYVSDGKRWRFIGAYLVYGQWKQAVLGGIRNLAAAYVVSRDPVYAHKAAILLDRVADVYPGFDYKTQGLVYEKPLASGYVSVWHDACEETRQLALAYDQIYDGIRDDETLATFLADKAARYKPPNPKASLDDIRRNIEDRILGDALRSIPKISSNYPRTEITRAIIHTVLGGPENREKVNQIIDGFVTRSTAVDGVTGEKGLANYSAFGLQGMATFLGQYARVDENFLPDLLARHPKLHQTYRFHVDTWCFGQYYPLSGDTGWFARSIDQYQGVRFWRPSGSAAGVFDGSGLTASMFSLMHDFYQLTRDPAFIQVLYRANDNSTENLPYDLFAGQVDSIQQTAAKVIAEHGPVPTPPSVNKQQWCIAILRSGKGRHARALWLDYDAGGGHGHADGMNLGLFAHGLDLMPDFGYPPVQYGGWSSPRANWYRGTAAHNTVVVDGKNQSGGQGKTTLWGDGTFVHVIRASAPGLVKGKQLERTAALIDVSAERFYVLDLFRVVGGTDHAKFFHSHFGTIRPTGLSLKPAPDYGHGAQMRKFRVDPAPAPGWSVIWEIEDRYGLLAPGAEVNLRYTDLTPDAQAHTAEAWIVPGLFNASSQAWIPRVMVRRRSEQAPLATTFVSIIEPYEQDAPIKSVNRLGLETPDGKPFSEANVALDLHLADGSGDLIIAADAENPLGARPASANTALVQKDHDCRLLGQFALIRRNPDGHVARIAVAKASSLRVGNVKLELSRETDFLELRLDPGPPTVTAGNPDAIGQLVIDGKPARPQPPSSSP